MARTEAEGGAIITQESITKGQIQWHTKTESHMEILTTRPSKCKSFAYRRKKEKEQPKPTPKGTNRVKQNKYIKRKKPKNTPLAPSSP